MEKSIADFTQVTPEWLTERLKFGGHLDQEVVVDVHLNSIKEDVVARLEVTYSTDTLDLPTSFVLKAGSAGAYSCVDNEVNFHVKMTSLMPEPLTVPWFDAESCESNVSGLYIAGTLQAGRDLGRIFIENSREHSVRIVRHLCRRLRSESGDSVRGLG